MKRTAALFTAVSIALAAARCSSPPRSEPLTMTGVYFDTVVEVQSGAEIRRSLTTAMRSVRIMNRC